MTHLAFAFGIGTKDSSGNWLEVFYPAPLLNPDATLVATIAGIVGYSGGNQAIELDGATLKALSDALADNTALHTQTLALSKGIRPRVAMFIESDEAPASVPEVYLKLQLISHRLCRPHSLNLDGMFGALPNVAWTSEGAIAISELGERQLQARLEGRTLEVNSVDKFPKMSDYVVPSGVRIADAARVRLGAFIGEGTTVMHEGFVNFNAGTLGKAMIEGRISAGVVIGDGSDLGGGASILGTLSGGGTIVNSVGADSLLGANAGLGFPLGDRCIIEAGLYVTAGTKVTIIDPDSSEQKVVKARELAKVPDLLFIRNSVSGAVEVRPRKTRVVLNADLHAND